ncbi:MAG TPA: CcmD family protein [Firmicutes bacterium]|nr:CcmD family protein [Bacillota bacterium]
MTFFAIGYTVIWLLLLGYTLFIHGQQRKLEKEVELLQELVDERSKGTRR